MNETTIPEEEFMEAWNECHPQDILSIPGYGNVLAGRAILSRRLKEFRSGYVVYAAKHAEEVAKLEERRIAAFQSRDHALQAANLMAKRADDSQAKLTAKDAEIEVLRKLAAGYEAIISQKEKALTAAREREEKAISDLSTEQQAFDEKEAELAAAKKIGRSAEIAVTAINLILAIKQAEDQDDICASTFDAMEREFKDLLAAYDASRAADGKEGA